MWGLRGEVIMRGSISQTVPTIDLLEITAQTQHRDTSHTHNV